MVEKLDKIDVKILNLLQENSKITNLELSKKIGLSPAPTLERVKKLELLRVIMQRSIPRKLICPLVHLFWLM